MKMNKKAAGILLAAMSTMIFTGCGSSESEKKADNAAAGSKIVVISREDGSGYTRCLYKNCSVLRRRMLNGKKSTILTDNAAITNNTSVMMTTVAGNKDAIGYISLGSLNDTVKALKIDGAEASAANVKSGSYKIARPFNICTKDGLSEVAQDFIAFIMSKKARR
mgnify:CR=1 FL=1